LRRCYRGSALAIEVMVVEACDCLGGRLTVGECEDWVLEWNELCKRVLVLFARRAVVICAGRGRGRLRRASGNRLVRTGTGRGGYR
jgi:hypothetical protein